VNRKFGVNKLLRLVFGDPLCRGHVIQRSEMPDPNLSIHFVTFRVLRRRLSHATGENSVYPILKFTAHAQYHVTCA